MWILGLLLVLALPVAATPLFEAMRARHPELQYTEAEWAEFRAHFDRHMREEGLLGGERGADPELEGKAEGIFFDARPAVSQAMAEEISQKAAWRAEVPERFRGLSTRDAKKMMGTFVGEKMVKLRPREQTFFGASAPNGLPASFDAREKWPSCPIIGHIRDQANCGSCWAFATTEVFNDRICIASGGEFQEELSVQHTVSCCNFLHCFSMGCNGGQVGLSMWWLTTHGVVSGGEYGDTRTCWPYELAPCAHHINSTRYSACPAVAETPSCRRTCSVRSYSVPFAQDVVETRGDWAYSLNSVEEIKQSLFDKGPVAAQFTTYEDFLHYKSGVYKHTTGGQVGGHAVKIIGWGAEDGEDYWLLANSWNPTWGDHGIFKMKQGECGIDDGVHAGDVTYTAPTRVVYA